MPRNGSGVYTLPQAAFTPNTTISSSAVNSDFSDIAAQLTNSLAADGQTTMTGAVKAATGSAASPSYSFGADTNTGFYSAGADIIGIAIGGVAVGQITSDGIVNGVPIGAIMDWAGGNDALTGPPGWLLCYGQSVATATYPGLFAVIGYLYGGSGPNFSIPDLRGRTSFGVDDMGQGPAAGRITIAGSGIDGTNQSATGGVESVTILQTNLPNVSFTNSGITINPHSHTITLQAVTLGGGGTGANQSSAQITGSSSTNNFTATINNQGTAASGGSDTPMTTLSNAIILNKIIFAGV